MERFWNKVDKTSDCWNWIAALNKGGYGIFKACKNSLAHRVSWVLHFGEIPNQMKVLHKCDNRKCVNPDHLFLGTQIDNINDMVSKGRQNTVRGSKNYNAKLTESVVKEIREKYSDRAISTATIARIYGVSQPMISYILINKSWKTI